MANRTQPQHIHNTMYQKRAINRSRSKPEIKAPERNNAMRLPFDPPAPAAAEESTTREVSYQPLKALSIRQPYAGLIMAGIKNIENRSWLTHYTGPLAIVSTQKPETADVWNAARRKCQRLGVEFPEALCQINGCVLGIVDFYHLVYIDEQGHACTDHPTLTKAQAEAWWNTQMIGFVFEYPRLLQIPIPISGRLGLYHLPAEVTATIEAQFK